MTAPDPSELFSEVDAPRSRFGACACVAIGDAADAACQTDLRAVCARLHTDEAERAAGLPPARRVAFIAGRLALRAAARRAGLAPLPAVLSDERGAPTLPDGLAGSISHKPGRAVAIAARSPWRLGIDLEPDRASRHPIERRVLTDAERAEVEALPERERGREVILRFTLKEAIYKAVDPFVRRWVGFSEVAVAPRVDGSVEIVAPGFAHLEIQAEWRRGSGYALGFARAVNRAAPRSPPRGAGRAGFEP
jgi:4'-phosphopantetheinyl transferase EntD